MKTRKSHRRCPQTNHGQLVQHRLCVCLSVVDFVTAAAAATVSVGTAAAATTMTNWMCGKRTQELPASQTTTNINNTWAERAREREKRRSAQHTHCTLYTKGTHTRKDQNWKIVNSICVSALLCSVLFRKIVCVRCKRLRASESVSEWVSVCMYLCLCLPM